MYLEPATDHRRLNRAYKEVIMGIGVVELAILGGLGLIVLATVALVALVRIRRQRYRRF